MPMIGETGSHHTGVKVPMMGVISVTKTAQVELRSGRVEAPAARSDDTTAAPGGFFITLPHSPPAPAPTLRAWRMSLACHRAPCKLRDEGSKRLDVVTGNICNIPTIALPSLFRFALRPPVRRALSAPAAVSAIPAAALGVVQAATRAPPLRELSPSALPGAVGGGASSDPLCELV